MSKKLERKVAVITGGNSGIDLATARRFVAEGARVFITGRRQAELDEAVGRIGSNVTGASKAAVRSFARCWTTELPHRKIRVNVISPGYTETSIFNTAGLTPERVDELKVGFVAAVPLGRMGTPDEVAKAAVFLASDDSSYVAGIELFVDRGVAQI
jgi:NAD(P)-dependent dehydrogenase (short-subunit alcohol dehydrogenase family)